jgi:hypothetical protein
VAGVRQPFSGSDIFRSPRMGIGASRCVSGDAARASNGNARRRHRHFSGRTLEGPAF